VVVHLLRRSLLVADLDRGRDPAVVVVDRPVPRAAQLRPGEVGLENGEHRLRRDREERVATGGNDA
jgi:hypothetical protein